MIKIIITLIKIIAIFILQYSLLSFFSWGQYLSLLLVWLVNIIIVLSLKRFPFFEIIVVGLLLGLIAEVNYLLIFIILFLSSWLIWFLARKFLTNRSYISYCLLGFVFVSSFYSLVWLIQTFIIIPLNWSDIILAPAIYFFSKVLVMSLISSFILIAWHMMANWWYKRYPLLQR